MIPKEQVPKALLMIMVQKTFPKSTGNSDMLLYSILVFVELTTFSKILGGMAFHQHFGSDVTSASFA